MTHPFGSDEAVEAVASADERATLVAFLEWYRAAIVRKASGVSEADARRRFGPSLTCIGGLVKHLRWVEIAWFQRVLSGRGLEEFPDQPWSDEDPDGDYKLRDDETLQMVIDEYEEECARSRAVLALLKLDATGTHRTMGPTSVRWVLVHMIEETARHAGHLDILRELVDGTVGE